MNRFPYKHIVVTGGANGLGRALVEEWLRAGLRVAVIDIQPELLQDLREAGADNLWVLKGDVTDAQQMKSLSENILREWKFVDLVLACAGVGGVNPGSHFSQEVDRKIFNINYFGTVHTVTPFVPSMIARGQGRLAAVCSLAGLRGLPAAASYSASKAAQRTFMESLRVDLAGHGIQVSCHHPGFIDTAMAKHQVFAMPFKISSERAARTIVRALRCGRRETYFPFPMSWLAWINRLLPSFIYDRLARLSLRYMKSEKSQIFGSSES